jgi:hypothetical protein
MSKFSQKQYKLEKHTHNIRMPSAIMKTSPVLRPKKLVMYSIPVSPWDRPAVMWLAPDQRGPGTSVIMFETQLFLSIWGDSPRIADGDFEVGILYASVPHLWKKDRKLQNGSAENGFSHGCSNPVPFAEISSIREGKLFLRDGITRTLWLLTHDAKALLFACEKSQIRKALLLGGERA